MSTVYVTRPTNVYMLKDGEVDWDKPYSVIPRDEFGLEEIVSDNYGTVIFCCDGTGQGWAFKGECADHDEITIVYGDQ